ncbi:hypothetical protein AKJ16_DCAP21742 [Drosera capensis]
MEMGMPCWALLAILSLIFAMAHANNIPAPSNDAFDVWAGNVGWVSGDWDLLGEFGSEIWGVEVASD